MTNIGLTISLLLLDWALYSLMDLAKTGLKSLETNYPSPSSVRILFSTDGFILNRGYMKLRDITLSAIHVFLLGIQKVKDMSKSDYF